MLERLQVCATARGTVALELLEVGTELIEEKRAQHFHDVAFAGVVRALLAAGLVVEHTLKERAEDGGGNFRPLEIATVEQRFAHPTGAAGEAEALGEQVAVHVTKAVERIGVVERGVGLRAVQPVEEAVQLRTEIGAVLARLRADELRESLRLENERVLGEQAEEHAHEQAFQLVAGEAAGPERIVQIAHAGVGFLIRGILGIEPHARLAEHEGERAGDAGKFAERERDAGSRASGKERQIALLLRLHIIENEAREIGDEDKAGNFIEAAFTREILNVGERLRLGGIKVFAKTLVLDEQPAAPEQINGAGVAVEIADVRLERGD